VTTPVYSLAEVRASQSKAHVPINVALRAFDATTCLSVLSLIAAPVGGEATGTRYIVTTGTGAFAGYDDSVAVKTDTGWEFFAPKDGWFARVRDVDAFYFYNEDAGPAAWEEFDTGAGPPVSGDPIVGETSSPLTPSANDARLFNLDLGPFGLPHWLSDNGMAMALTHMVGMTIRQFRENGDDATIVGTGCAVSTVFGNLLTVQPTYASRLTSLFRAQHGTTTGVSQTTASVRASSLGSGVLRGSVAGKYGGFLAHFRFGSTACSTANAKLFVGLNAGAANLDTVDPASTMTDCVGIAKSFGDANVYILHNDASGAPSKTSLGFTLASLSGKLLDLYLFGERGGNVRYALYSDHALVASGELSTDLPTVGTRIYPIIHINNANVTTVQNVEVVSATWFDFTGVL
jgi:hypothetical protein